MQIRKALNIRADESRMASLVIGVMLLTSAGFTLGSTGVEALFFARFGVEYLPYMYMVLGTLSFLTSLGITALLGRVRRETLYIFIPIGVAILTLIAWMILFSKWNLVYPILWLGKEVINSLIGLVVWGIAGTVCDTRQAKRLFPLFNAGRILGAVIGGLGTGILVRLIGAQNLLLAWAVILIVAFFLIKSLLTVNISREQSAPKTSRRQRRLSLIGEMQQGFQYVRKSPLMIWISVSAILFSILYFSIALPFSKSATLQYADENALAGFLGIFNGITTATAFLASIFLANRLYARIGIMNAVLILPLIYLAGFGGLAVTNAFAVIMLFRFAQMVWLSGMADSAYQAIFNPVPSARRDQVRAFIDGVPGQAGTFIAGFILLIGEQSFSSQQLALVGLAAALATTYVIWRANRAYNLALVDALRNGRPTIFAHDDRIGTRLDSAAIKMALDGLQNSDPIVRRVSAQMLGEVNLPSTVNALVGALADEDLDVRVIALRGLANQKASSALSGIASLLSDPQPAIRAQAVDILRALTPKNESLSPLLTPMLEDRHPQVKVRTIVALLSFNPDDPIRTQLRRMAILGETDERVMALYALAEIGDPQALEIFIAELNDEHAPLSVRCAAASVLSSCGMNAIPALIKYLSTENHALLESAASALGKIGEAAQPSVLNCLDESDSEDGALLALDQLPARKEAGRIKKYIERRIASSLSHEDLRLSIHNNNDRTQLLADSLGFYARRDAINSLRAFSLLGGKDTVRIAIENLQSPDPSQKSNALETLETVGESKLIRPLLRVFESNPSYQPQISEEGAIALLEKEKDEWLRACAKFAFGDLQKDNQMETTSTLSVMERIVHLHRVPLLSVLPPQDLQRVADLTAEQDFVDNDLIFEQGDAGGEMYVIVLGEVRIIVQDASGVKKEIARRKAGDVVGEMSIISGDARNASVIAVGDVRLLSLDRLSFEGLLRERPAVCLAVMKELCNRLTQLSKSVLHEKVS